MLPNFIIAGATRSGTTSLYYYLMQHPDITFPKLKEPRYFSSINLKLPQNGPGDFSVDKKLILDYDDYKKLYENIIAKKVGDASSEYLYHYDVSAKEIKEKLGDIPIIIILRNPIERAFSAFNNLVRDGRESQNFFQALKLEDERMSNNWDMMWHYKRVGLYYNQITEYLNTFSKVKVIIFEEFVKEPEKFLSELCSFLDVNPDVDFDSGTVYSYSGKPKNKLIAFLGSRNNKYINRIRVFALSLIPRNIFESVSKKVLVKNQIDENSRSYLRDFYKDDILKLQQLLKKDLSFWN